MATKTMSNPRELFLHELGDALYAEQMLLRTLPELEREASDSELAKGFQQHAKETRQQVDNLQKAFKKLGASVKAEQCPGIEGIKAEHDLFMREAAPAPDVLDSFLTGAAARTEHYEIAVYEGLIAMARAMGERDVVQLLDRNLKQEKEQLKKVNTISKRLAREGAKKQKARQKAAA
jgi:ferritin-like metal-binding protein YciE